MKTNLQEKNQLIENLRKHIKEGRPLVVKNEQIIPVKTKEELDNEINLGGASVQPHDWGMS